MTTRARLLLDTHVVLWWLMDDAELSDELKETIDEELEVFVSSATVWELAIKQGLGKLSAQVDLAEEVLRSDLQQLPITFEHAIDAGRLPLHHRDPFDRMLVAQARVEQLTLVTRDSAMNDYDVRVAKA
ncbi:type II toxin-antitoxin system VapC family toxin [Jiangella alkaliphila]|uniref:PIN domain nuclease, a component of toxin-antitoxin system (PIN domain) n=1 Tax=Jiangella alkaliphila TaxID=419479 RepID=A0A1H2KQ38_9ACTN|nr:type II toxin-antitoxin system VapC family toxin [Jiangella alkaliphila]SDU70491.1 PIN domain nuclease, a component of toxin-antitoxin system (PIN domain) [Jiangella alkaliphila]